MKNKNLLILEFNKQNLKYCLFERSARKRTVIACASIEIDKNDYSQAINDVLFRFYKREETDIAISLSRSFFLMRYLKLPSMDLNEMGRMLPFQLLKVIPHTLNDVFYDFTLVEQSEFSKVLVFIIQKNKLQSLLGFIKESKLNPLFITISSQGLFNWLKFQRGDSISSKEPVVLIDVNNDSAELLIYLRNKIAFSRNFDYRNDRQLLEEINHSLGILQKEFGHQKLSEAIFTGLEKKELAASIAFVKTSFLANEDKFSFEKKIKQALNKRHSYSSILGLLLERGSDSFNFSPEFVEKANLQLASKKKYSQYVFLGLQVICILIMLFSAYLLDRRLYLGYLNSKLIGVKGEVQGLDLLASRLKVLDKEFLKKPFFSLMFYELISTLPQSIQFTLLEVKDNNELILKGYADDISEVFKVVQALNNLKLFNDVKAKYATEIKQEGKIRIEFYIYSESNKRR